MKGYRLIFLLLLLVLLIGCGTSQQTSKEPTVSKEPANADEAALRASLTESFDRIKEGDKTVMYENELSYYHLDVSLSQYLELKAVRGYGADSLMGIEIDSISFSGDSARVHSRIKFESADGSIKEQPANIKMYRDAGRWVRPYISRWDKEVDYLEQKRVYDSVTAGE
jgi:hypothetical protein